MFRRIRRRIPIRLRQNWVPLVAGVAAITVGLTLFGDVTIRPYSTSASVATDEERITQNITGTVDLFDEATSHEVSLTYSDADYDDMLDAYFTDGDKDWMPADITIDGTVIENVGIRLKGNSTLSSLVDDREGSSTQGERAPNNIGGAGGSGGPPSDMPSDMQLPDGKNVPGGKNRPHTDQTPRSGQMPSSGQMPGSGDMPGGSGGMGTGIALSTDEPENLPLLVSFDKYQSGRAYQGRTEVAIRPASESFASSLNEAVALDLTQQSGQASQKYAYSTLQVNDRPASTRLVIENPDAQYAGRLDGDGVLYKLRSTSTFTYKGNDQTEYTDDFTQVNLQGSRDLQPIVSFLKWLDQASDDEFENELSDWLDVDSFATYLATQDVLNNMDSMSGPGRNAYLYYDLDTGIIRVISWDLNLSFGGLGMPGAGASSDAQGPEGDASAQDGDASSKKNPMADSDEPGMNMMADNELVTRFEENDAFAQKIDDATDELTKNLVSGESASDTVSRIADLVPVTDGVDQATIDDDAQSVLDSLTGASDAG